MLSKYRKFFGKARFCVEGPCNWPKWVYQRLVPRKTRPWEEEEKYSFSYIGTKKYNHASILSSFEFNVIGYYICFLKSTKNSSRIFMPTSWKHLDTSVPIYEEYTSSYLWEEHHQQQWRWRWTTAHGSSVLAELVKVQQLLNVL